jgi:hypothetical protein
MGSTVKLTAEQRRALACAHCDSEVTAVREGAALMVSVAHDDWCPWHQRAKALDALQGLAERTGAAVIAIGEPLGDHTDPAA